MRATPRSHMFAAFALTTFLTACSEETPPENKSRPVPAVTVMSELLGETFSQTGTIQPRYETPMSFQLDGRIVYRVENSSIVKKDDLLATVEKTPSLINVSSAQAQVDAANSDVSLADLTAARNWELFAKSAISRAQVQQGDANLKAAKAKLEVATAALASAQQTLSYTDLKAGQDGIVSGVSANLGQVVAAGQTILTLSSNAELDAVFDVPETMLREKLNDADVEVRLLSDPALVTKGKIREVMPSADAATRTYRVKVSLESAGEGTPMGAAVTGKVVLSPKRVFRVPASALASRGQDQAVLVYEPETKTLEARIVKVERYAENNMFISEGLADGDIVATAGVSKLRDGEAVTIAEDARP